MVKGNYHVSYVLCFLLASLFSWSLSAQEPKKFKVRAAYHFQDLSFTTNAHGANFLVTYDKPKKWGVRGGFHYINKFGDSAPGYDLGGTWWATKTTTLSLDAEFAPQQVVIPRQAYTLEVSQVVLKKLVPAIGYKFADYRDVDSHIVMPSVTWYFYPRWDWMTRYFMNVSQFGGQNSVNHSVMTRINWNLIDPVTLFAGYARANESFESGNPNTPVGSFSANHVFGGFKWELYKGLGLDTTYDYENRNNGSTLHTVDVGLFYRW